MECVLEIVGGVKPLRLEVMLELNYENTKNILLQRNMVTVHLKGYSLLLDGFFAPPAW